MKAYYNEFDPKAAAWLRELIRSGLIADGDVDGRSITDVTPSDLIGYSQCHFFAGIGGWSYALRLAGIEDSEPVWTASLPCQPFSVAGKGLGKSDERHLLPHFLELVRQSKPERLFGEQVAAAISHGWLDDLQAAMEAEGYACGAAVLGAHSVGAFHQRQRLYWVANNNNNKGSQRRFVLSECSDQQLAGSDGMVGRLGYSENNAPVNIVGTMGSTKREMQSETWQGDGEASGITGSVSGMGITDSDRCISRSETTETARHRNTAYTASWSDIEWIECRDNKLRAVKPGIQCLADGVPARVVRLRGYGNAIVPQLAAEFISAFYDELEFKDLMQ